MMKYFKDASDGIIVSQTISNNADKIVGEAEILENSIVMYKMTGSVCEPPVRRKGCKEAGGYAPELTP